MFAGKLRDFVSRWWRRNLNWLKAPPLLAFGERVLPRGRLGKLCLRRWLITWIRSPHFDPLREICYDAIVQLRTSLGHFEICNLVANDAQQQTVLWLARDDDASVFGLCADSFSPVECQVGFSGFGGVVALIATLDEHRSNVRFEELDTRAGRVVVGGFVRGDRCIVSAGDAGDA